MSTDLFKARSRRNGYSRRSRFYSSWFIGSCARPRIVSTATFVADTVGDDEDQPAGHGDVSPGAGATGDAGHINRRDDVFDADRNSMQGAAVGAAGQFRIGDFGRGEDGLVRDGDERRQ
jgi:hypothetical protein